jgi:type VI secretion system secreted protein Hcp
MAVDYFLKLDGIPGESVDAKHKNEIDVLGFNWGVSQSGARPGGGRGAGKAVFDDLIVLARASKASPLLWLHCASGQHIKTGVLTCRRAGKAPAEFLKITLTDVLITSYEVDGDLDEAPVDQVGLAFGKIETVYTAVAATGKALPPVKAAWDVLKNAKA